MSAISANFARSAIAHLPVHFVCWALALPATATPLTGASLYSSVQKYASFGEHRTGSTADHQTSEWLASELETLGFDVERQRFELKQFFSESTQLIIGNQVVPAFPHWFPQIVEQAVVAPLAELPSDPVGSRVLTGRIAYLAPERAGEWHELDVSTAAVQAAEQGAVALVVAVPHPSKAIYARNAAEPFLQNPLPLPTLIVAANAAPLLTKALTTQQPVTFELDGRIDNQAYGVNVLGRLDRGNDWIVVSTPSSGWFTAAGERGGGIALWLDAARWVAKHDRTNSYVFVSNSSHELDMMGSKHTLPLMPDPASVKLWLHLGASIGTRQWVSWQTICFFTLRMTSRASTLLNYWHRTAWE